MPDNSEDSVPFVEAKKLLHDYLKHLATLSTGSILVMVTFLEKLFQKPEWKLLVSVSLVGFMLSVVMCILVQSADILDIERKEEWALNAIAYGLVLAWVGFLIGVLSLGVFALKNL